MLRLRITSRHLAFSAVKYGPQSSTEPTVGTTARAARRCTVSGASIAAFTSAFIRRMIASGVPAGAWTAMCSKTS